MNNVALRSIVVSFSSFEERQISWNNESKVPDAVSGFQGECFNKTLLID